MGNNYRHRHLSSWLKKFSNENLFIFHEKVPIFFKKFFTPHSLGNSKNPQKT